MLRVLWRRKILVVFIVALLVLFPAASVRPAQAISKTILLSVGIEKVTDGYTVTGTVMESETANKIISANGATVPQALDRITANTGRKVSLAHCNLIVLGETLRADNVAEILYYFLGKFEVSNNTSLIWTDGPVEKILKESEAGKSAGGAGLLEAVAEYNQKHVFKKPVTLDAFYKNYLHGKDANMLVILLKDDEIYNTKQMAVFKDGRFVHIK